MDAFEEGQIIRGGVSVHAGIYVFPPNQVKPNETINVCATILKFEKVVCNSLVNSPEKKEEIVELNLNG